MSVRGFAIKVAGEIDVRTVAPSETMAMLGWLVVHIGGGMAWINHPERIREIFAQHAAGRPGLACVKVNITEAS